MISQKRLVERELLCGSESVIPADYRCFIASLISLEHDKQMEIGLGGGYFKTFTPGLGIGVAGSVACPLQMNSFA